MKDLEVFSFFIELCEEEKKEFFSLLRPISLSANTLLHYEGDVCTEVLLLTQGYVRLYTQDKNSYDEITLYTLGAGEQCIANTASVLGQSKTVGTALTQTPIKGYLLKGENIQGFMRKSATYQNYIISLYAKKMLELTHSLQRIRFKNLDERIMDFFKTNQKATISITHQELANKMDTSRTVVSRVLKVLEQKGRVKLHRGYIELCKKCA